MSVNLYNATTDTLKNVAGDIINVHSVNEMIATVEEGDTASRAYSEGEQFIINGILYHAMTNIAQGEAFDYDVNYYESSPLAEQVDDKQDKTDNSLTTTSKTVVGAINEVNSALLKISVDDTTYTGLVVTTLGNIKIITGWIETDSLPTLAVDIRPRTIAPFVAISALMGTRYDCYLTQNGEFNVGSASSNDRLYFTVAYV